MSHRACHTPLSPGHLLIWLAVALLVLLAIPAAIVRRRLGERRRARAPAPKPQLPPLERALQLLEWANSRREGSDRRRALELVAVELSRGGRSDLSTEARALAWQARTGLSACFCGVLFLSRRARANIRSRRSAPSRFGD